MTPIIHLRDKNCKHEWKDDGWIDHDGGQCDVYICTICDSVLHEELAD